ncbi:MAG TPA: VWA domain-containing protein [Blastocatellia bacterium]|nr:VWA domain-containing protein [Blastocatellia bacterium]
MSGTAPELLKLKEAWAAAWPEAMALWSKFTRLSEPRWCFTVKDEKEQQLSGSFAMIRLTDHAVVLSLRQILEQKLENFPLEIMGHEIGHHVYCPADLNDQARVMARIRRGLPTKEAHAAFIANLYTDLLINDRLQRSASLNMAGVYKQLGGGSTNKMWTFYMRIYEILWSLQRGSLATGKIDSNLEVDAHLGARLIRAYAKDWVKGAGRFAMLCLPYLLEDEGNEVKKLLKGWLDTEQAGAGGMPDGLTEIEAGEIEDAIHPAEDDELAGVSDSEEREDRKGQGGRHSAESQSPGGARGQCREPFEYGEILKSLGINLDSHEMAVRYYRERAIPYLVRFPSREMPESLEPLMEGLETWDIGSPVEDIDWFESAMVSDRIIPGYTTVQRAYGMTVGSLPDKQPIDLDLYVDCSGSMPNPQYHVSYLTLAGAIISLSALRAGSRVQATLWSGKNDYQTTNGFTRNEHLILQILTGYIGGATAFPIHILRDTFKDRKPTDRRVHILIISDDGVTTLFDKDEQGNSGWDVSRMAIEKAGGGATMVLNLWGEVEQNAYLVQAREQGWNISRVQTWNDLVIFAREFSKANYGKK